MTTYQQHIDLQVWRNWCADAPAINVHEVLDAKRSQLLPLCQAFDDALRDEGASGDRRHAIEQLSCLILGCADIAAQSRDGQSLTDTDPEALARIGNICEELRQLSELVIQLECIPPSAQRFDHYARRLEWAVRHYVRAHEPVFLVTAPAA